MGGFVSETHIVHSCRLDRKPTRISTMVRCATPFVVVPHHRSSIRPEYVRSSVVANGCPVAMARHLAPTRQLGIIYPFAGDRLASRWVRGLAQQPRALLGICY